MTMLTKVKTGVPGFDVLTHGGLPIKMRGSAHATHPYRLQIGAGGPHIERWSAEGHLASTEAEARWTDARS
jgi:hypothetical protein